jgi:hypothetical protein
MIIKILYYFKIVLKFINKYLYNENYVEIIVETQNMIMERGGVKISKMIYSKSFQAITYYIKETKPNDIFSKREPDKNERDNNPIFDIFIPDQNKPFLIDNNKKLYCTMKIEKDIYESNKDKADISKRHVIKLFSTDINTNVNDIEIFIDKCLRIYKKYNDNKTILDQYYFYYVNCEDSSDDLIFSEKIFSTNRTFDTVFFENKNIFIQNLNFFLNNEKWYYDKGIPYHYGILLHGIPGCGKTSIIKAILHHTKRNAIVIPLNRVKTCGELENIFFKSEINNKNIPTNKRVYIFEDIDCLCNIIKDRETNNENENKEKMNKISSEWDILSKIADISIKKSNKPDDELNLSCILNLFDGILEMPGRMIILTTNYPEYIDKALLRPGRIDMNIELKKASKNIIIEILSSFYSISNNEVNDILKQNNIILEDYKYSPAYIMNICQNNINDILGCIYMLNTGGFWGE